MSYAAKGFEILVERRNADIEQCKQEYIQLAEEFEGEKDFVGAELAWRSALQYVSGTYDRLYVIEHIALSLNKSGRTDDAIAVLIECLAMMVEVLGPSDTRCASVLNKLAGLYFRMGEFNTARELCLDALQIYQENYGCQHKKWVDVYNNLAAVEKHIKAEAASLMPVAC